MTQTHTPWQPIETAPEDGTEVLVYTSGGNVMTAYISDSPYWRGEWMNWEARSDGMSVTPTHWMPLPPTTRDGPQRAVIAARILRRSFLPAPQPWPARRTRSAEH